jgi:hypothetical protein
VEWRQAYTVDTPWGAKTARATIVPDPCVRVPAPPGVPSLQCDDHVHKLWQLAGPDGIMYPDCAESGPYACDHTNCLAYEEDFIRPTGSCVTNDGETFETRELLLASASSLISTNGSHIVDLRWWGGDDITIPFVYDPAFDDARLEERWIVHRHSITLNAAGAVQNARYWAEPFCYGPVSPQRDEGMVDAVEVCDSTTIPEGMIMTLWWTPPPEPPPVDPPDEIF